MTDNNKSLVKRIIQNPYCQMLFGTYVIYRCSECNTRVYPDWKVCPKCTMGIEWSKTLDR